MAKIMIGKYKSAIYPENGGSTGAIDLGSDAKVTSGLSVYVGGSQPGSLSPETTSGKRREQSGRVDLRWLPFLAPLRGRGAVHVNQDRR
jgi:hypothetical protein